jgi:hypothetical protein
MDKARFQIGFMKSKKSLRWMLVLMGLGLIALYAGPRSLLILIPAAVLICYEAGPVLWSDRN